MLFPAAVSDCQDLYSVVKADMQQRLESGSVLLCSRKKAFCGWVSKTEIAARFMCHAVILAVSVVCYFAVTRHV